MQEGKILSFIEVISEGWNFSRIAFTIV